MLVGETKLSVHIPCCHLCRVASGVMAELGGGNSCQTKFEIRILLLACVVQEAGILETKEENSAKLFLAL